MRARAAPRGALFGGKLVLHLRAGNHGAREGDRCGSTEAGRADGPTAGVEYAQHVTDSITREMLQHGSAVYQIEPAIAWYITECKDRYLCGDIGPSLHASEQSVWKTRRMKLADEAGPHLRRNWVAHICAVTGPRQRRTHFPSTGCSETSMFRNCQLRSAYRRLFSSMTCSTMSTPAPARFYKEHHDVASRTPLGLGPCLRSETLASPSVARPGSATCICKPALNSHRQGAVEIRPREAPIAQYIMSPHGASSIDVMLNSSITVLSARRSCTV